MKYIAVHRDIFQDFIKMVSLITRTLFGSLVAILGLMGIVYCYQGLNSPWSEHHFNDSYSRGYNIVSEFQTINGTTTYHTWIAGYDVLFADILYTCGLATVSVSCLMVVVYFCRKGKDCHPAIASSSGSICLWLSLMLWLPLQPNLDSTLTLTWYRLIIITSLSLLAHTIVILIWCCQKHKPDTYIELPATIV
jgi:hypothetical protein